MSVIFGMDSIDGIQRGDNCLVCIYPVALEQLSCILEISLIFNPAPEGRRQVLRSSSHLPARSHNWCPVTQALHDRFLLFVPPDPLSTLLYLPYPPGGWPLWTIWPRFPRLWLLLGFSQWEAKRDWERKERAVEHLFPQLHRGQGSVLTVPEIDSRNVRNRQ